MTNGSQNNSRFIQPRVSLPVRQAGALGGGFTPPEARAGGGAATGNNSPLTGFTVVEIVVIISILLLISSVLFANFPAFYQRINLQRSGQNLALALRKAQNMASAVRQAPTVPPKIPPAFGIYIGPQAPANSYIVFADFHPAGSPNGVYDAGANKDFVVETGKFESNVAVSEIIFPDSSGLEISVSFSVPDGAAKITKGSGSGEKTSAEIILASPGGQTRKVVVRNTGQIYTK